MQLNKFSSFDLGYDIISIHFLLFLEFYCSGIYFAHRCFNTSLRNKTKDL